MFNPQAASEGERRRLQQFLLQRGARFEPQDIDRIRLIQAQKLAGKVPVSEKLKKEQKKKKRKARRGKNLRSEVARAIREKKRFEQGERRDKEDEEPRIVGEPRSLGGVDPEIERERIALQRELQGRRELQQIAERQQRERLQREELAVRRGELAAARADRAAARAAALPAPPPPAPVAPDVRIGDIAPVINVPAQPPAQLVFMPDRPEPNIRDDLKAAAKQLGEELRGQNREFHEVLRDEAEAFRQELRQNVDAVDARQQAQDEQVRADAARQDAVFQDVYERLGQQEAAIGESRDAVIDEIRAQEQRLAGAREQPPPNFDDVIIDVDEFERSAREGLRAAGLSPADLTLSPRSPSLQGSVRADPDNVVLGGGRRVSPELESPVPEGSIPPTPSARLPSTPEELAPAPQPERAEIEGGGPLDLPSVVIDARPAIDRSLEDDLLASEASRARFEEDRAAGVEAVEPAARQGPSPRTDVIRRTQSALREILDSGNRGEIAEQEEELADLVDDAEAQPEARLRTDSPRASEVPVAQRVENIEGLQERSGGTSSASQRWADLEAEFAQLEGERPVEPIAPSPTPRALSPEAVGTPRGEFRERVEPLLVPTPRGQVEDVDTPGPAAAGGARVLEGGGGFIEEALSPRELEAGEEPLLEEVGSVRNKAQSRIETSKRTFAGAQETIFSDVRPGPRGPRAGGKGGIGFRVRNNTDKKLKKVEPGDVVNVLGGHAGNVIKLDTGAGTAGTRVGAGPFQKLVDDGSFLFEEGHRHELGGHFDANPYGPPVEPALGAAAGTLEEELAEVQPEAQEPEPALVEDEPASP
tara:strand:+ start:433 stop:2889 length:2457 start_codon:yes stop_codon:yes gene_type:complete